MDSHRPLPPERDTLTRFLFEHAEVRGEVVRLDATWRAVLECHAYPEPIRNLLGEMMAAASLLAATLKFEGALIMQMQGSGPVTLAVVECSSEFHLRATAKWRDDLAPGDIATLLGQGKFVITIDPKSSNQIYQGIVALEGTTVAEVLEHYMLQSEQLETRLWLAADGEQACGLLLQRLPENASPGNASEDADAWNRALNLGNTLTSEELLKLPAREILHRLFHEEDLRLFDAAPSFFPLHLLARTRRQYAALIGLGRSAFDSGRARQNRSGLRVLQSALPLRCSRRRAVVRGGSVDTAGQHAALIACSL